MSEIGLPKDDLDTPVLWIDLDVLESNISAIAAHFKEQGVNWRPHTKGIKIPAIAHKALAAGAIGVTCAKLGEAEVMAANGVRDILVANQVVGARKITRLVHVQRQADVKIALDDLGVASEIGAAARGIGVEVPVLIEVNTGMNRAGVESGQASLELAKQVHDIPGVALRGMMTWEGHAVAVADPDEKQTAVEAAMDRLRETVALWQEAELPLEIVSGGGSGTAAITPGLGVITEIQAGGAIMGDVTYRNWWQLSQPALHVRATVTSRPTPERVIIDAGYKTLPRWHGVPQPQGVPAVADYRTSAEHGILVFDEPMQSLQVGDGLDILVGYGDSTLYVHDELYGIRNGLVEVVWPIVGRGKLK